MLIKLKTLVVENHGYKRQTFSKDIYINSDNIVSISDHPGIEKFLLEENLNQSGDKFSLIKVSFGSKLEEIIAYGTSANIFSLISESTRGARILND